MEDRKTRILEIGSDDGLIASFAPDAGMVCCSLTHRGEQVLGLRGGLDAYIEKRSTMGIPLLHPWANRLARRQFEVAGREVDVGAAGPPPKLDGNGLPIHGLMTAAPGWEARSEETADGGRIVASFQFDGALAAGFPFPHSLTLVAEVAAIELRIELSVLADAGSEVPIAFGFHPYLAMPGVPRRQWEVSVPVETGLPLDERGLPTGDRVTVEAIRGPLGDRTFDDAFVAPSAGEPFRLSGGGRSIEMTFDRGFPFAQLYAPPGEELLAWEPMTAPTNALVSGDDLRVIAAGQSHRAAFTVTVGDG